MPEISKPSGQMEAESRELQAQITRWKYALPIIAAALAAAYVIYFWALPRTNDPDKWGTFGDFFGGLMNPLVAFAAFYWLTQSVKLQKKELAETKDALRDAAIAQSLLVENGRVGVQLSALTALVSSANDEISAAVQGKAALTASRPSGSFGTDQLIHDVQNGGVRAAFDRQIRLAQEKRETYLKEMQEILDAHRPPRTQESNALTESS